MLSVSSVSSSPEYLVTSVANNTVTATTGTISSGITGSIECSDHDFWHDVLAPAKALEGVKPENNTKAPNKIFGFTPKYAVPGIKDIIVNPPVTVVLWDDDTKTVSRPEEGEGYDMYTGFMACVCKKLFGSVSAAKRVFAEHDTTAKKAQKQREKEEAKARNAAREETARNRKHRRLVKEYVEKIKAQDDAIEIVRGKEDV